MRWRCPIRSGRFPRSSRGGLITYKQRTRPLRKIDRSEMNFILYRVLACGCISYAGIKCIFIRVYFYYF